MAPPPGPRRGRSRTPAPSGPVHTLSPAGGAANSTRVAVDADGDAVVVWTRLDGTHPRVQARRISAAGALGPVRTLSLAGQTATNPELAVDGDGDAYIVWYRSDVGGLQVYGRALSSAGAVGPLQRLSRPSAQASNPRVAVDETGDGLCGLGRLGRDQLPCPGALRVEYRDAGPDQEPLGGGSERRVRPGRRRSGSATRSRSGRARWAATPGFRAGPISAAGVAGAIKTLSAGGQNAVLPQISIDGAQRRRGVDAPGRHQRAGPGRGRLANRRRRGRAHAVGAGAKRDGASGRRRWQRVATVVWQRSDGSHLRIQERPFSPFASPQPIVNLSPVGRRRRRPAGRALGRRRRRGGRRLVASRRRQQPPADPGLGRPLAQRTAIPASRIAAFASAIVCVP